MTGSLVKVDFTPAFNSEDASYSDTSGELTTRLYECQTPGEITELCKGVAAHRETLIAELTSAIRDRWQESEETKEKLLATYVEYFPRLNKDAQVEDELSALIEGDFLNRSKLLEDLYQKIFDGRVSVQYSQLFIELLNGRLEYLDAPYHAFIRVAEVLHIDYDVDYSNCWQTAEESPAVALPTSFPFSSADRLHYGSYVVGLKQAKLLLEQDLSEPAVYEKQLGRVAEGIIDALYPPIPLSQARIEELEDLKARIFEASKQEKIISNKVDEVLARFNVNLDNRDQDPFGEDLHRILEAAVAEFGARMQESPLKESFLNDNTPLAKRVTDYIIVKSLNFSQEHRAYSIGAVEELNDEVLKKLNYIESKGEISAEEYLFLRCIQGTKFGSNILLSPYGSSPGIDSVINTLYIGQEIDARSFVPYNANAVEQLRNTEKFKQLSTVHTDDFEFLDNVLKEMVTYEFRTHFMCDFMHPVTIYNEAYDGPALLLPQGLSHESSVASIAGYLSEIQGSNTLIHLPKMSTFESLSIHNGRVMLVLLDKDFVRHLPIGIDYKESISLDKTDVLNGDGIQFHYAVAGSNGELTLLEQVPEVLPKVSLVATARNLYTPSQLALWSTERFL